MHFSPRLPTSTCDDLRPTSPVHSFPSRSKEFEAHADEFERAFFRDPRTQADEEDDSDERGEEMEHDGPSASLEDKEREFWQLVLRGSKSGAEVTVGVFV